MGHGVHGLTDMGAATSATEPFTSPTPPELPAAPVVDVSAGALLRKKPAMQRHSSALLAPAVMVPEYAGHGRQRDWSAAPVSALYVPLEHVLANPPRHHEPAGQGVHSSWLRSSVRLP